MLDLEQRPYVGLSPVGRKVVRDARAERLSVTRAGAVKDARPTTSPPPPASRMPPPSSLDCCVFCLTCRGNLTSPTCTYGLGHEFPKPDARQVHKGDASLCTLCGLHPKNPKSGANGCAHSYGGPR